MDGFIISGAPIERLPYEDVYYYQETIELIDYLTARGIPQLFSCWGAMVALHHLYGIGKAPLNRKLFGVFPHHAVKDSPLLTGIAPGFLAPHARYTEMKRQELITHPALTINAETVDGHAFLVTNGRTQTFLFAHLEYGSEGLWQEYQREISAHPDFPYQQPLNDGELNDRCHPFYWQDLQQMFFKNWLAQIRQAH